MGYKKLISPEFKISTSKYEITSGMEVECFSSREARSDWCRVELTTQLQNIVTYEDMEEVQVELGYEGDYDVLLPGYCRKTDNDYWKEIMIRDDMIKLERITIKQTFLDCTPQDVIKYILTQAGVSNYQLSEEEYGKKSTFLVNKQNGIKAILEENENILSMKKYGDLWEIETLGVPWIHHSQEIEVSHSKYTGTVKVEKTIIRSDSKGYTRMYIYFKGG